MMVPFFPCSPTEVVLSKKQAEFVRGKKNTSLGLGPFSISFLPPKEIGRCFVVQRFNQVRC